MSFAKFVNGSGGSDNNKDLESGAQNGVSSSLNYISSILSEFTSLISNITRLEKSLGTKRDSPAIRSQADSSIDRCLQLYDELIKNLDHLDTVITDSDNNTDKELTNLKFSKDIIRQKVEEMYKNYKIIVRKYNEKMNSALVQDQYQYQESLKNKVNSELVNDKTPLINNNNIGQGGEAYVQEQIQVNKQNPELLETSLQYHSDLIQQRDHAIVSISQGVQDINKIFKDLDEMVNQQGEQIDSIENSIVNYANNNQLANHELIKAENYQKKKQKWSCILLVALVIVLLILLSLLS